MYDIDYETIEPFTLMQKLKWQNDKERIKQILDLWIFTSRDNKLVIPSYKCTTNKKIWNESKQFKSWFAFNHQIFWFSLMEMKDLDFAITEVKRILQWEKQYLFPNGTLVTLDT